MRRSAMRDGGRTWGIELHCLVVAVDMSTGGTIGRRIRQELSRLMGPTRARDRGRRPPLSTDQAAVMQLPTSLHDVEGRGPVLLIQAKGVDLASLSRQTLRRPVARPVPKDGPYGATTVALCCTAFGGRVTHLISGFRSSQALRPSTPVSFMSYGSRRGWVRLV